MGWRWGRAGGSTAAHQQEGDERGRPALELALDDEGRAVPEHEHDSKLADGADDAAKRAVRNCLLCAKLEGRVHPLRVARTLGLLPPK